jgi:kynurenine formamidase
MGMAEIPIDGGRVFDLEQPRTRDMPVLPPHQPGFDYFLHRHHEDEYERTRPRTSASGLIVCTEHSGTHIDAICHQADDLKVLGGVPVGEVQTSRGFTKFGADEIPPIVAPGVLLDVPASKGVEELEPGYEVTVADLEECCDKQGVSVGPGTVALVRTGNGRHWKDPERYMDGPGVAVESSRWLAEQQVLAVGADNMAWDVRDVEDPELGAMFAGHLVLIVHHGIYIIENLLLEELASAGVYEHTFVCAAPKFAGATGAPVRPLAIAPSGHS